MEESAIIAAIQRGCRNPRLSSSDISSVILRGVTLLGNRIKQADPSYFLTQKSISSTTNVFSKPSDCLRIENIWDLGLEAIAVTGTGSESGEVTLTAVNHNFLRPDGFDYELGFTFGDDSGDIATVHDVGGTTEANGVWRLTYIDADTVALQGSTYSNAWTSGGYIYKNFANLSRMERIEVHNAQNDSDRNWYPRADKIIVDDYTFTNSIIIDYEKTTSAITDIPSEYHEGLVSFGIINLIRIPKQDDPLFTDIIEQKRFHQQVFDTIIAEIDNSLKASGEPKHYRNIWS